MSLFFVSNLCCNDQTCSERRQWSGQNIDTLGTNADSSSALAVIGRESPQGLGICAVKQQQKYAVHSSSKRSTPNAASTPSLSSSKLERQRSGQSVSDAALEVGARCESRPRSVISTAYSFDDLEESRGEGVGDASGRGEKSRFGRLDMQTLSEHEGAVNKLWTSRESNLLLSASNDGTIRIWGGRGTCSRAVLDTGHFSTAGASEEQIRGRTVRQEDAKRDSSTLKVNHLWAEEGLDSIWGGCSDYNLRVWNGGEGRALRFIKGHDDIITCMDGGCLVGGIQSLALVATGSADKTVRVFDVRSKKPQVFIFRGHTDAVLAVKMGDGGRTLLTGGKDKSIRIFDLRAGRLRVSLDKHFGAVSAFRLIADMQLGKSGEGSGFVSGGRDSMINVWTMAGDHVATQAAHRNFLSRFSTSANEDLSCPHFLTTGADATVKIWDARRIRQVGEVKTGPVTDVVYHSGRSFATTSPTGLVRQWATATTGSAGEPLSSRSSSAASTREWTATDLAQHSSACTDLVSSASLLASASKSGQICRWSSSS